MKNVVVGIIVAIVVVGGIWYLLANGGFSTADMVKIDLVAQNASDQSGEATIESVEGGVKLSIDLGNAVAGTNQPANIYTGSCEDVNGSPIYPLTGLVDGKSETMIAATLEDIKTSPNPLSIRIFKSETENIAVSCGNFPVVAPVEDVSTDTSAAVGSVDTGTTTEEVDESVDETVDESAE